VIFDDLAREWEERDEPLPETRAIKIERYLLWFDRSRAMTHALYADRGWQVLVEGPVSEQWTDCGAAMIEEGVAREVGGDLVALEGAQAGIGQAVSEIRSTLTATLRRLPAPLRPLWSGPIPLPPED
jgi:hypothetical protein